MNPPLHENDHSVQPHIWSFDPSGGIQASTTSLHRSSEGGCNAIVTSFTPLAICSYLVKQVESERMCQSHAKDKTAGAQIKPFCSAFTQVHFAEIRSALQWPKFVMSASPFIIVICFIFIFIKLIKFDDDDFTPLVSEDGLPVLLSLC